MQMVGSSFESRPLSSLLFLTRGRGRIENPAVLRPGFVGIGGQWSYYYGMQNYEYAPHESKHILTYYRYQVLTFGASWKNRTNLDFLNKNLKRKGGNGIKPRCG